MQVYDKRVNPMQKSAIPDMLNHLPKNPGVTEELIGFELPVDLFYFYRASNGADNTAYTTTGSQGTALRAVDRTVGRLRHPQSDLVSG